MRPAPFLSTQVRSRVVNYSKDQSGFSARQSVLTRRYDPLDCGGADAKISRSDSTWETDSREWGLHVTAIRLQDIDVPDELKKIMSRRAGAEREKRATITKAEGDKLAAENRAAAATIMARSAGARQLQNSSLPLKASR